MNWKYYIPHVWERERTEWEDIYLMPFENGHLKTVWLSVNALNFIGKPNHKNEETNKWIKYILNRLEDNSYYIDEKQNSEMYVNIPDFTQTQLLEYAALYLNELGYEVTQLLEGNYQEFEAEIHRLRN